MTELFLILLFVYLLKIALFSIGDKKATKSVSSKDLPTVSVIIAARNEEQNIGNCLKSLSRLDYPRDKLEIIVINDQSTDRTGDILTEWKEHIPVLRAIETKEQVHNLRGKANAVAQAIEQSSGEIIITTDADCVVPTQWVRETVRQYTAEVGCVCGYTLTRARDGFSGMQAVDWAYMLAVASAGVGWKFPLSAVGNNMSFRRKAYDDVGGYKVVGYSIAEDFILFKAISYKTKWKVRYPITKTTLIWSEPCVDLKEIYRQKKRWGIGGLRIHPFGFLIMSVGFLMSLSILVLPFFGLPFGIWAAGVVGKFIGDAVLLYYPLHLLGQKRLYKYFFHFELYCILYVTALPIILTFSRKVVWKGRKL